MIVPMESAHDPAVNSAPARLESAFSLIEIIIAMTILAILFAVAAPSYMNARIGSRNNAMREAGARFEMALSRLNADFPRGAEVQGGFETASTTLGTFDLLVAGPRFAPVSVGAVDPNAPRVAPADCSGCPGVAAKPAGCTNPEALVNPESCKPYLRDWPSNPFGDATGPCEANVVIVVRGSGATPPGCLGIVTIERPDPAEPSFRLRAWGQGDGGPSDETPVMIKTVDPRGSVNADNDCGYGSEPTCPGL